ncbi:MAG: mechanosensitive ion channel domain-containing protein [Rhizomicrobium sp.]
MPGTSGLPALLRAFQQDATERDITSMHAEILTHATKDIPPVIPVGQATVETLLINDGVNLVAAIIILILGWLLAGWAARGTAMWLARLHQFDDTLKPLAASLVRYAILLVTIIAVLERFGVETTSLIAVLGAAGLAIGLALQGTLSNVAAGAMLLLLRPFRVNEAITAAGQSGVVREVGLFTTILIGADQSYISVPNAAIFSGAIVNASREPTTRINFAIPIDIASDVDVAEEIVMDILASDGRVLKFPPPRSGTSAVREYAVDVLVRFWVLNADSEGVQFDVMRRIKQRFNAAGIAVPPPGQAAIARGKSAATTKTMLRQAG